MLSGREDALSLDVIQITDDRDFRNRAILRLDILSTYRSSTELDGEGNWFEVDVGGASLFSNPAATWYHSNQYHAEAACEHCGAIIRHERWCVTRSPLVRYAYQVAADPDSLSLGDRMILHALGVSWQTNPCAEPCKKPEKSTAG